MRSTRPADTFLSWAHTRPIFRRRVIRGPPGGGWAGKMKTHRQTFRAPIYNLTLSTPSELDAGTGGARSWVDFGFFF